MREHLHSHKSGKTLGGTPCAHPAPKEDSQHDWDCEFRSERAASDCWQLFRSKLYAIKPEPQRQLKFDAAYSSSQALPLSACRLSAASGALQSLLPAVAALPVNLPRHQPQSLRQCPSSRKLKRKWPRVLQGQREHQTALATKPGYDTSRFRCCRSQWCYPALLSQNAWPHLKSFQTQVRHRERFANHYAYFCSFSCSCSKPASAHFALVTSCCLQNRSLLPDRIQHGRLQA